ncbi:1,4-beta-D-glucan cellobiohydrolase CEL6B [Neonectria ditissima]|uniref:Glucanase n=1 Tax=Neonectria ditissima TaxID=78410 RepID=A0A0P7AW90_9HYPO|nr:1,4-beta-D-glucan cellobiohydrolase CEL6B [Neonectria ditissima]
MDAQPQPIENQPIENQPIEVQNNIDTQSVETQSADAQSPITQSITNAAQVVSANPWRGKTFFVNPRWADKLEPTYNMYKQRGDEGNAAKVRTLQKTGTFVWISHIDNLPDIDSAIQSARAKEKETGKQQIVGLVLYNIPGRDYLGGASANNIPPTEPGLRKYKKQFVNPFAEKVAAAKDLNFAIILEPDVVGNLVTAHDDDRFKPVAPFYERGTAYAIMSLQLKHVSLYLDAANGGWLGWPDKLEPGEYEPRILNRPVAKHTVAAKQLARILQRARDHSSNRTNIRGFSTNVSNFNPFNATESEREPYTQYSESWDESRFIEQLVPYLKKHKLPLHFIVDQSRVALPGARTTWGQFENVPAKFGMRPGTSVKNKHVDSIVWVKPAGESDGNSPDMVWPGPPAGAWFPEYVERMVSNSNI